MDAATQPETVAKPPLTIRLPHKLNEQLEALVKALNARRKLGAVTKTDIIVEALEAQLPAIRARELGETDPDTK